MVVLQHRLSVKLSQRQILTPGLVQMVSVLALNKLELKDMINAEMVENPVLEELEDAIPLLDDVGRQEEERDRLAAQATADEKPVADEKKDPFEEIDFGSFFQDYLDPGYRSRGEMEEIEKPSFENFLSKPGNLSDHLLWQLGAISVSSPVHDAAQVVIGNLSEDGYLIANDEEMLGVAPPSAPEVDVQTQAKIAGEAQAIGLEAELATELESAPATQEYGEAKKRLSHPRLHFIFRLRFPPLSRARIYMRRSKLFASSIHQGSLAAIFASAFCTSCGTIWRSCSTIATEASTETAPPTPMRPLSRS
jgi:hypothetical protein